MKESEFILAEINLGVSDWQIIRKHILPHVMPSIIIFFTLGIGNTIAMVASISYLGFGSESTLVWGKDLSDAIANSPIQYWWGLTFISLSLFLLILGFNLLGDALRDALEPSAS